MMPEQLDTKEGPRLKNWLQENFIGLQSAGMSIDTSTDVTFAKDQNPLTTIIMG